MGNSLPSAPKESPAPKDLVGTRLLDPYRDFRRPVSASFANGTGTATAKGTASANRTATATGTANWTGNATATATASPGKGLGTSGASPPLPTIPEARHSAVDRERIKEIVEKFMKNGSVNNRAVPDFVERAIYENVLVMVMGLLEEVASTTAVEVMGHRLEVRLSKA